MKVKNFVEQFEKSTDKQRFVSKHIKETYMPYAVKMSNAARIVRSSTYAKNDDETEMFKISSPTRYLLFVVTVVQYYTDIEINTEEVTDEFDILNECGAVEHILATIGKDVDEFQTIVNMTLDDEISNTRDLTSFFEMKLASFEAVLGEVIASMAEQHTEQ